MTEDELCDSDFDYSDRELLDIEDSDDHFTLQS